MNLQIDTILKCRHCKTSAATTWERTGKARLVVPMSLSQGGNAIVLGHTAADHLTTGERPARLRLLDWLRAQPTRPRFAVVHAFSTHNLLLRYWLCRRTPQASKYFLHRWMRRQGPTASDRNFRP